MDRLEDDLDAMKKKKTNCQIWNARRSKTRVEKYEFPNQVLHDDFFLFENHITLVYFETRYCVLQ